MTIRSFVSIQPSAISYQLLMLGKAKATFEIEERIKSYCQSLRTQSDTISL
ncbi:MULTISPECIES: hypothetical protein [Okeania]|uniref:hypothetical protein n=1 Tax=Okeania TaxID=1458928 RepID=UPI0013750293|nr:MULTISPECIES: hypothetical protein [Okeania]NET23156.1 hypothetical protein [Okeania sp. SIO1H5]NET80243.1 hypothetical protein [Okeania sp. SIO1F9]NET96659.1 hypothetical protein [Okeania sp. SIO1H2]